MNQNGIGAVSLVLAGTRRFQTKSHRRLAPLHLAVHDGRALADVLPPNGTDIKPGVVRTVLEYDLC